MAKEWLQKDQGVPQVIEGEQAKKQQILVYGKDFISAHGAQIAERLAEITASATGRSYEMMLPRMQGRVPTWDVMVVATEGSSAQAYGGFMVYSHPDLGAILYESAKMTSHEGQGKGLGRKITQEAVAAVDPQMLALRTQNPAEINSVRSALPSVKFAPIDISYTQDPSLQIALQEVGNILHVTQLDTSTGLCAAMYDGRFGDFSIDMVNPRTAFVEEKLQAIGLNRERGDAILMLGKVK